MGAQLATWSKLCLLFRPPPRDSVAAFCVGVCPISHDIYLRNAIHWLQSRDWRSNRVADQTGCKHCSDAPLMYCFARSRALPLPSITRLEFTHRLTYSYDSTILSELTNASRRKFRCLIFLCKISALVPRVTWRRWAPGHYWKHLWWKRIKYETVYQD